MDYAIWIGLFTPLLGFLLILATSDFIGRRLTGWIACGTVFISFMSFVTLLYLYNRDSLSHANVTLFHWLPIKNINADFTLHIDPLSLLMTLIITGVGFLIHVYSNGYMEHEEDYARFFACLNFFIFCMLLLVLAEHLLLLYAGWEGVGLASYLLIGFWYTRPAAAKAATKAFVVNRIGDLGLLLGLLLTFNLFGTGDIGAISDQASKAFAIGAPILTILTLLYFFGATGKSAQLPLHTWLPDAMEGPTPVSALIHAATMVTAGVYLVVRMHSVFSMSPTTMTIIGIIGGTTALFAALSAVGQIDLKRVLAYSTISQLGLMFLATGIGAFYAAMFHLTMHAFVKALLFLSAGNVVHMMHGSTNMEKMGGLSNKFPYTHWLFLLGVLAMSGVPPLGAFFSKDLILEEEYFTGNHILFYVGFATSVLTAFYLIRAYCLTFTGPPRLEDKVLKAVHEAPRIMLTPIFILGILSVAGGFLGFCFCPAPILERFLNGLGITLAEKEFGEDLFLKPETWLAIGGVLFGVALAGLLYTKYINRLGENLKILRKSFYIDEIYDTLFVKPLRALSNFIDRILEPKIFDGSIHAAVDATQAASRSLQQVESGQIRSYVAWMVIGTVLLIAYLVL